MPGGDGTGPRGFGPMSGHATGFCAGFGVPGYANFAAGRGYRAGGGSRGGGGRGFRNRFYTTGQTGWQRAAGYGPVWGNPFACGGPYHAPTMPVVNRQQEVEALMAQAEYLEDVLEGIRMQLKELEEKRTGAQGS